MMGEVRDVWTQNESAPSGKSDQKLVYFLYAPPSERRYNSSAKALVKENSSGVIVALNQNSSLKPKQILLE